ncbi:unnamed protein product, partial [Prorocentrum cordatum]
DWPDGLGVRLALGALHHRSSHGRRRTREALEENRRGFTTKRMWDSPLEFLCPWSTMIALSMSKCTMWSKLIMRLFRIVGSQTGNRQICMISLSL